MSFTVFGSYFPAWVACLLAALFVVTMVHVLLRQTEMLPTIPLLPLFYLLLTMSTLVDIT